MSVLTEQGKSVCRQTQPTALHLLFVIIKSSSSNYYQSVHARPVLWNLISYIKAEIVNTDAMSNPLILMVFFADFSIFHVTLLNHKNTSTLPRAFWDLCSHLEILFSLLAFYRVCNLTLFHGETCTSMHGKMWFKEMLFDFFLKFVLNFICICVCVCYQSR